jgi:cytoskeletal protein CcmA (bactofilin family)
MPDSPRKAPFTCPECGYVQQESTHLISTYCRSCGSYYEVRAAGRDKRPAPPPRQLPRVQRTVHCHRCGETHEVSSHAQSTICPGCSTSIQFEDVVVSSNVSRPIDTRGKLIVEETGNLSAPFTVCGDATIFGKISGTLHCEGAVRLHSIGKLNCRVTAKTVIIEKGARVEFIHPVETGTLEVHGEASGRFEVDGKVKIGKGGLLEGKFHARAIVVDGGSLLAESSVESVLPAEG